MTHQRKNAEIREKELRLAIFRIERGRAHTKATRLSVSSVAREAGVTPALIHNHYPAIAEEIRVKQGASSREQRDLKQNELNAEREKRKALKLELEEARKQLARLASINEMLVLENRTLRAVSRESNVVSMAAKKPENS
ncbi:TetR family transcriptional regulator [Burkholderia sp. Ac-20392]|uniref:TetR family transcriptional regulator n=1 Tax=Burkholderia sp. Ac-20392 TaxID=2703905 RepID=UPI001980B593|nr:TetR family transcriptional regulator [Burkholderia sp. Ac-20392]MBN3799410.1 TetR family transcriptional regulator [Burkholderia sp. Ac-20392]